MDLDDATRALPEDAPAAYLHLVDSRSLNQSQRTATKEHISALHPYPHPLVAPPDQLRRTISDMGPRDLQDWTGSSIKVSIFSCLMNCTQRCSTLAVDNDPDFMVSRNHCEVYVVVYEPTINHLYVRDRKSSNGTFVNGRHIGSGPEITPGYLLQDGDVIEIRPY
ncbi:hypothetical protein FZEAL_6120 [Fusarium zealandicum]|uniref:FHA domain-containing protein n=1 Tax=Fusarium zealandicum TaxID=1053134 RepID=A0A8H4UIF3_9HYPO|nr:hypothetical protein FZEAL_6120 [Fusarium zealandicum]